MNQFSTHTLRGFLLMTVAGGMLMANVTSGEAAWFSRDDKDQQAPVQGELRRPVSNPNGVSAMDTRAPASNPGAAEDSYMRNETVMTEVPYEQQPPMVQEAPREEEGGMFSWLYKDSKKPATARAPQGQAQYQQAAPVNTMERRVPQGNQGYNGGEQDMYAQGAMAAPVNDVNSQSLDDPFQPAPLEGNAAPEGFPSLAEVPARPQRLDEMQPDARMAELEQARAQSQSMQADMQAAYAPEEPMMAHDPFAAEEMTMPVVPGSVPQAQPAQPQMATNQQVMGSEIPEWAQEGQQPMAAAPAPTATPMASDVNIDAEFASIVGADGSAPQAQQPMMAQQAVDPNMPDWAAEPMVAPQTQMASAAPVPAVQEGEWIDLSAGAGQAQPVDQIAIQPLPEEYAAPVVPVQPNWNGNETAGLNGVRARVNILPESRYAQRRQAVYMQRYARFNAASGQ